MPPSDLRSGDDAAPARRLDRTWYRRVAFREFTYSREPAVTSRRWAGFERVEADKMEGLPFFVMTLEDHAS
jgi:hypothetical protein